MQSKIKLLRLILQGLLDRDRSPYWLLVLSFAVELISIIFINDSRILEMMDLSIGISNEWVLFPVLLTIITLQITFQYSTVRMVYPLVIKFASVLPATNKIAVYSFTFFAIIIDVLKTSDRNFTNDIADSSDWIKILHYISIFLRNILQNSFQKPLLNGIMLVVWIMMIVYRTTTYRKDIFLKLLHQNLYLISAVFIIEEYSNSKIKTNNKSHFLIIGICVAICNFFLIRYGQGSANQCNRKIKNNIVEVVWKVLSVLYSRSIQPKQCRDIQFFVKENYNQQNYSQLQKLVIATKKNYIQAVVYIFENSQCQPSMNYFLLKSQIAWIIKQNAFLSFFLCQQANRYLFLFSLFDRIHLYRQKREIAFTLSNLNFSNQDFSKYLKNQAVIQKMKQSVDWYQKAWMETANADYCVLDRLEENIDKFINTRNQMEKQLKKILNDKVISVETRKIYANFAYLIEKNTEKTEEILEQIDRAHDKVTNYDHSNSLFLQVSLMEQQIGNILSISQNCMKLLGYKKDELRNIDILIPKPLRSEHQDALRSLIQDPSSSNAKNLFKYRKNTFCYGKEDFCEQVKIELNLAYNFNKLTMVGRLIFNRHPRKFKCAENRYFTQDEIVEEKSIENKNKPRNSAQLSIGIKTIILSLEQQADYYDKGSYISQYYYESNNSLESHKQNPTIQNSFQPKKKVQKSDYHKSKVVLLCISILFFIFALLLNTLIKVKINVQRFGSQQDSNQLSSNIVINQFMVYYILSIGYGLEAHLKDRLYPSQAEMIIHQYITGNKIINQKIQNQFPFYAKENFLGSKVQTTSYLQLQKLNTAISAALDAQANSYNGQSSFDSLIDTLNGVEDILDNIGQFPQYLKLLINSKKSFYESIQIAQYILGLFLTAKVLILLIIIQRFNFKCQKELLKSMMLLSEEDLVDTLRTARIFTLIINGMRIEQINFNEDNFSHQVFRSSKNTSFSNIDSNAQFRLNTVVPLKLNTISKVMAEKDAVKDNMEQQHERSTLSQRKQKLTAIYLGSLFLVACIMVSVATIGHQYWVDSCRVVPYIQNLLYLKSLPNSYYYVYTAFLHYSLSSYSNSTFYNRALQKYVALDNDYTLFDTKLTNYPQFDEFNVLKFNVDLADIETYTDCTFSDILITPQWRNKFIQNTVRNSLGTAIGIIKNLVQQQAPLNDSRFHVLVEIQILYFKIFDRMIDVHQQASTNVRSRLFANQRAFHWLEFAIGFLILLFIVIPACKRMITARNHMKVIIQLLTKSKSPINKPPPSSYDNQTQ